MTGLDRLADRVANYFFVLLHGAPIRETSRCSGPSLSVGSNTIPGGGSGRQHSQCCYPHAVASSPVAGRGQVRPGPAPPRADLATPEEWRDQVIAVMDEVHGSAARQPSHGAFGEGASGAAGGPHEPHEQRPGRTT